MTKMMPLYPLLVYKDKNASITDIAHVIGRTCLIGGTSARTGGVVKGV
jgi:hypothetical protein